jgi:hypothetical protein
MSSKRCRRRPDLFSVLILLVALGMTMTLAYQVNVYYGGEEVPIAGGGPGEPAVGG